MLLGKQAAYSVAVKEVDVSVLVKTGGTTFVVVITVNVLVGTVLVDVTVAVLRGLPLTVMVDTFVDVAGR